MTLLVTGLVFVVLALGSDVFLLGRVRASEQYTWRLLLAGIVFMIAAKICGPRTDAQAVAASIAYGLLIVGAGAFFTMIVRREKALPLGPFQRVGVSSFIFGFWLLLGASAP